MSTLKKSTHKTKKNKLSLAMLVSLIGALLFAIPSATSVTAQTIVTNIFETNPTAFTACQTKLRVVTLAIAPEYRDQVILDRTAPAGGWVHDIGTSLLFIPGTNTGTANVTFNALAGTVQQNYMFDATIAIPDGTDSEDDICKNTGVLDTDLLNTPSALAVCPGRTATVDAIAGTGKTIDNIVLHGAPDWLAKSGTTITAAPPRNTVVATRDVAVLARTATLRGNADVEILKTEVRASTHADCPTATAALLTAPTGISVCPEATESTTVRGNSAFTAGTMEIVLEDNPTWVSAVGTVISATPPAGTAAGAIPAITVVGYTADTGGTHDTETLTVTVLDATSSDCTSSGSADTVTNLITNPTAGSSVNSCEGKITVRTVGFGTDFDPDTDTLVKSSSGPSWLIVIGINLVMRPASAGSASGTKIMATTTGASPKTQEVEFVAVATSTIGQGSGTDGQICKDTGTPSDSLLTEITDISVCSGQLVTREATGGSIDHIVLYGGPSWLTKSGTTITAAPPIGTSAASRDVVVLARTSTLRGSADIDTLTVTVLPTTDSSCPIEDDDLLNSISAVSVCPGRSATATLVIDDSTFPSVPDLTYSLTGNPTWVTVSGATVSISPPPTPAGTTSPESTETVTVLASTGTGVTIDQAVGSKVYIDSETLTITVRASTASACASTPTATLLDDTIADITNLCPEKTGTTTITGGTDFDAATTSLSLSAGHPVWVSLSGITLSATPPRGESVGTTNVTVNARTNDAVPKTDAETIAITVVSPTSSNACRVVDTALLSSIPDISICPGQSHIQGKATLPEPIRLTQALSGSSDYDGANDVTVARNFPSWASVEKATITVTPPPIGTAASTTVGMVQAYTDGTGGRTDTESVNFIVLSSTSSDNCLVDDEGLLTGPSSIRVCPQSPATKTLSGSLIPSSAIVTLTGNPAWVTVPTIGATITVAPPSDNSETGAVETFMVTVRTDAQGGRRDTDSLTIMVLDSAASACISPPTGGSSTSGSSSSSSGASIDLEVLSPELLAKIFQPTCSDPNVCLYSSSASGVIRGRSLTG